MKRYFLIIFIIMMCIGHVFSAIESKGNDDLLFVEDNIQDYTDCSDFGENFWCGTYEDWTTECNSQGIIEEPFPGCDVGVDDEYGYCLSCNSVEEESLSCGDMKNGVYCSVASNFNEESFLQSPDSITSAEGCSDWCESVDESFSCCSYIEGEDNGEFVRLCGVYKDSSLENINTDGAFSLNNVNICSKQINKKEVCSEITSRNECSLQSYCQPKSGLVFLWNIFPWWGFKECVDKVVETPVVSDDEDDVDSDTPVVSTKVAKINTINEISLVNSEVLRSYNLDYDAVYRVTYDIRDYNNCYLSGDNNIMIYYTPNVISSHVPLEANKNSKDILITTQMAGKTNKLYINCDGAERLDAKNIPSDKGSDSEIDSGTDTIPDTGTGSVMEIANINSIVEISPEYTDLSKYFTASDGNFYRVVYITEGYSSCYLTIQSVIDIRAGTGTVKKDYPLSINKNVFDFYLKNDEIAKHPTDKITFTLSCDGEDRDNEQIQIEYNDDNSDLVGTYLVEIKGENLNCDDTSIVNDWYQENGRCGEPEGLSYWKTDIDVYHSRAMGVVESSFETIAGDDIPNTDWKSLSCEEDCSSEEDCLGGKCHILITDWDTQALGSDLYDESIKSLYKDYFDRDANQIDLEGYNYWLGVYKNDLDGMEVYDYVKEIFDEQYDATCVKVGIENGDWEKCHNSLLCPEGYEYIPKTEYCKELVN